MAVAFVFPGQGSQAVGMGKALAEAFAPARRVFEEVDDALGEKLSEMTLEWTRGDVDADRERTACAHGRLTRRAACPRN